MITREQFVEATGYEPENDDLERVNCTRAGELGHFFCGWNTDLNQPQFAVGARMNPELQPYKAFK